MVPHTCKTNLMILHYENTLIENVSEFLNSLTFQDTSKYLGVKFDNTMSWASHVDYT